MSDFSQHGLITTLQRFGENNSAQLEAELEKLAGAKPIALILPCHARELGQPALAHVLEQIAGAKFIREIVVSMNGLTSRGVKQAQQTFSALPQPGRILWNDSPRAKKAVRVLAPGASPVGKGFNVWSAIGLLSRERRCEIVALLDCDVTTFRREMLVRLCYACARPELSYELAKMYYSRVTDRIYGRVSRLFLAPLLQALVRVLGHQPLLDFLLSFRYPLAGEMAMTLRLASSLSVESGWGFEIAHLCEAFRQADPRAICQVDGGLDYNHRHQSLGGENGGLIRMSKEIGHALLSQLIEEGLPVCTTLTGAILASYGREASEALARYRNLALINGLAFDAAEEQRCLDGFAHSLAETAAELNCGAGQNSLPSWTQLATQKPEQAAAFFDAAILR